MPHNPSGILPLEHAAALNEVNLQMAFGNHGYYIKHPTEGVMVLGIDDRDYGGVEVFVDDMHDARGDVLACEAFGYEEPWSTAQMTAGHLLTAKVSPHLQAAGFEGLAEMDPEALTSYYQLARDLRILSPIEYANGRAVAQGVSVAYADANASEMAARGDEENWGNKKKSDFRDGRMVAGLGQIAATMVAKGERPELRFLAGWYHRRGVERLLEVSGVSYTSVRFGPARLVSDRVYDAKCRLSLKLPTIIPNPATRHIDAWERNLLRHQLNK